MGCPKSDYIHAQKMSDINQSLKWTKRGVWAVVFKQLDIYNYYNVVIIDNILQFYFIFVKYKCGLTLRILTLTSS